MPPKPSLTLVHELADERELHERIRDLHDIGVGRLVIEASPDSRNLHWLALDVLRALGKKQGCAGSPRNSQRLWDWARAWTAGEQIQDLIVTRAQNLSLREWNYLVELAVFSGARLWLISQGGSLRRTQREMVDKEWPFRRMNAEEFLKHWAGVAPRAAVAKTNAGATVTHDADLPQLPGEDFTTFLAACRDLLSADDFERVDVLLADHRADTHHWLTGRRAGDELTEDEVAEHLRARMRTCRNQREMLVLLRAAQITLFYAGWLVKVSLPRLAQQLGDEEQVYGLDEPAARLLRGYSSPRYAAIGAVALATRAGTPEIEPLDVNDITAEGDRITLAAASVEVPDYARGILRTHLLCMDLIDSGTKDDALFLQETGRETGDRCNGRASARALSNATSQITKDTGLSLSASWNALTVDDPRSWVQRHGVGLTAL